MSRRWRESRLLRQELNKIQTETRGECMYCRIVVPLDLFMIVLSVRYVHGVINALAIIGSRNHSCLSLRVYGFCIHFLLTFKASYCCVAWVAYGRRKYKHTAKRGLFERSVQRQRCNSMPIACAGKAKAKATRRDSLAAPSRVCINTENCFFTYRKRIPHIAMVCCRPSTSRGDAKVARVKPSQS